MIQKPRVITGFNRGASTYNQVASMQAKVAAKVASSLAHHPAHKILEIGCGTGLLSQHLVQNFPNADLYLTDIAESMLYQCQKRLGKLPNVTLLQMDGESLSDLPQFDLITSSMTFHWFSRINESIQQLMRTLAPRGRLIFSMLADNSFHEWRTICDNHDIPHAMPKFPSMDYLTTQNPQIHFENEIIEVTYPTAMEFLHTLKLLGAVAPRESYQSITTRQLRSVLRKYNRAISMTYDVVYGEYQTI